MTLLDPSANIRLLFVHSSNRSREHLAEQLQINSWVVRGADTLHAARKILDTEPFDCLAISVSLADGDRTAITQMLQDRYPDLPVVFMTDHGHAENMIDLLKLGYFSFLVEPTTAAQITSIVLQTIRQQRLLVENRKLQKSIVCHEVCQKLPQNLPPDEQVKNLVDLARTHLRADGVTLLLNDTMGRPGDYCAVARSGQNSLHLSSQKIFEQFLMENPVLTHADDVENWIRNAHTPERSVQSFAAVPIRVQGAPLGMLHAFVAQPGQKFSSADYAGLEVFAAQLGRALEDAKKQGTFQDTFTQTMEALARALEAKDKYTHGHSDRVAIYAELIAKAMDLPQSMIEKVRHAGCMHDIGKIGLHTGDLNKTQKLTAEEFEVFKSHPIQGKRIIEPIVFLRSLIPCIYHHHECFDGHGYPEKLGGDDIPIEARILAVADSYDAMTSNRPYRKALPHAVAVAELKQYCGKQYDPQCVDVFIGAIETFRNQRQQNGLTNPD